MASRIAGITVEIGGDTTKLTKALSGVNKSISQTQAALKDVNKLLKLDPGNAELLTQKQKLLKTAIDETKSKLTALQDAAANSDLGAKEHDALQREIAETEQKLESLEKEYKDFGSVAKQQIKIVGEKMQDVGKKMTSIGMSMTKGLTVPIAGAAAASVAAWNEVDEAMDTVAKKTGATGDALTDMQERAKNIAMTVPTSFQTAADAVGEVNTRFGLTGDALEELSTQFVEFAALNNTDVSSSIDAVQSALAAFGLSADDAGAMLDVLNKAGQDTGVSVDQLAGLMTTNAAALKEMGYSASDAAMLLANLDKNGIDASAAMTGLKKAYAESVQEGIPMSDMLSDLEARLQNSGTHAQAAADALDIFGTKAGGQLVDALTNGRLSFESLGTAMTDFSGNVSTTFNETLDPMDSLTTTMNQLKTIGADLVETAGPMLTQMFQGIADVVGRLSEAWNGLNEEQQQLIIKIAGIAAVAGPVLAIGGKLVSGIGSLVSAGSGLIGTLGSIGSKFSGIASGAGNAVNSMSSLGTAASGAAAPMSSAGGAMGTLSQNALGLVAAGAGILLAAGGIALLAQSAIAISEAGPGAAVAMVGMVAAVAALALGAAALAPALTAGAAGLVAFGAAVALIGVGILAATTGVANLASKLPLIVTYGAGAAAALVQIGAALTVLSAGALLTAASVTTMLLPFAGAALTIGATDLALVGLSATLGLSTIAAAALGVAMLAVSAPVRSIKDDAQAAGKALEKMVTSVDVISAALDGLKSIISDAAEWFASLFKRAEPDAVSAAESLAKSTMDAMSKATESGMKSMSSEVDSGMSGIEKKFSSAYQSITSGTDKSMAGIQRSFSVSLLSLGTESALMLVGIERQFASTLSSIQNLFAGTRLRFNQSIALPHFYMSGSFNAKTGSVPRIGVSWYKKAMQNAMVLDNPTIFGQLGDQMLGGGEAGREVVSGESHLVGMISKVVDDAITRKVGGVESILEKYLPDCARTKVAVPVNSLDRALARNAQRRTEAW